MADIKQLTSDFEEYLKDESRSVGSAQSISFPRSEDEVRAILAELRETDLACGTRTPVTVQGGRTGLAAGACPRGGHVMNLTKMNRYLGMRREETPEGPAYFVRVQPGLVLSQLRKDLEDKNVPTSGWDEESLAAWEALCAGPEHFFPTDPTEVSATIGGMVACNASGARSYRYKAVRPHVSALRVVLADGQTLALRRGQTLADGLDLALSTEQSGVVHVPVPGYCMPNVKNASGYFAAPGMDAVDLFVGSDGTLGVICEVELALMPLPAVTWGVSCFFTQEPSALDFTAAVRAELGCAAACEFFDVDALAILRRQKEQSTAFAALPAVDPHANCCVYVELACGGDAEAYEALYALGAILERCGGSERDTWVARTALDRESQRFFRHAVPESVNMLIDERRKVDPTITKLGSDMSVPDEHLHEVVAMYRRTLAEEGLQTAVWGHIGNNHLHVNVLPNNADEYARGKELFKRWAADVTAMGGAVSAEHGVGKLKSTFLTVMYGEENVRQMAAAKAALDPRGIFGRGNLFSEDVLDALIAQGKEA